MRVRQAQSDDRERIRAISRDSLQSSYSLSPQQIETILGQEVDDTSLKDLLKDSETAILVVNVTVEGTEAVYGCTTLEIGTGATNRWLHVDPEARGIGIATALLGRVRETFDKKPIAARVLEDAVKGGEFLEGFGFEQSGHDQILLGGEEFAVTMFTAGGGTATSVEPSVPVPESVTVEGADRPVDHGESLPGREAPFLTVYSTGDEKDLYGYFCAECGSTDVAADGQDRLECGNCGNTHLADGWDDAYL